MSSINRRAHVLQREKTLTIPRHFIFFDTETEPYKNNDGSIRQDFKLGWAVYYGRAYGRHKETLQWLYIDSISTFWDFVYNHTEPKQRLWIIARNIVFDFTVCMGWEHLRKEGYKLKFFHNNGCSVIVTVNKGNRSIVFLDSMNWFTESLAKTGERIGIPKLKIDFATCTMEQLSGYCRNDVLIELENFKLFIRFLEGNAISRLCYTKASTAMAAYLFRHYNTSIYIHNNAEAIKLERESYKGGRCECFYIGDLSHEKHYILDVNSLYPFVMQGNLYPVKYIEIDHKATIKELGVYCDTKAVVAKVQIETDEPVYAVKNKRTIFPIGIFETTLCTPELKYALEHGHIKRVIDCVVYEQAEIFTSYVTSMYALRRDFIAADVKEYEVICKYLLNSLYGKFGQKAENWQHIGEAPDEPDREEILFSDTGTRIRRLRYLLGQLWELKGHSEAFNSFPAISAHVTAYARLYLWSLMKVCGIGNYFYCDTDSLIVNELGLHNLEPYISLTELGKLKLEDTIKHLVIHGLKDYVTDTKTVVKGIRKNAKLISEGIYTQECWPSFKGIFKTDDVNKYTVKNVTKHLTREYTKGIIEETGSIRPYIIYDGYELFLSETLSIKQALEHVKQEIIKSDIYQAVLEADDVMARQIGFLGVYYGHKGYKGEVKQAIENYPAIKGHITFNRYAHAPHWDGAIQEGMLQRTGDTDGYMDIDEFLDRLGKSLQARKEIGYINRHALEELSKTGNPYDEILVAKYDFLKQGYTPMQVNKEIEKIMYDYDIPNNRYVAGCAEAR